MNRKLIRLPQELLDRLNNVVEQLNTIRPDANYSANSIIVQGTLKRIAELEEELKAIQ